MKLSLCLAALVTADERKFTNKDDFMNAETPGWWTTKPAVDKMATLECKRADYFSTYFGSTTPRIQQLWADAISDIEEVVNKRVCLNDPSRRRRDAEEERGYNACTDWKQNDVWTDTDFFMKFVGTFVREVIYRDDQAHCQRLGYRIVSRGFNSKSLLFLASTT